MYGPDDLIGCRLKLYCKGCLFNDLGRTGGEHMNAKDLTVFGTDKNFYESVGLANGKASAVRAGRELSDLVIKPELLCFILGKADTRDLGAYIGTGGA